VPGIVADSAAKFPVVPRARDLDREVWAMAWPAMLSLVVVNLVDVVDVALIGHLGRQTMAAWGYAARCVQLVETLLQSLGIGCVALMARAIGANDPPRARRVLAASVLLSQGLAGLGLLIAICVPRAILRLLDAAPDVIEISVPYFRLLAGAMMLYGAAFVFECGLRANKNTRGPMGVAISVMVVKTTLSLVLIFGLLGSPRLGLTGAGIATVCAHGVGLGLYTAISRLGAKQGLSVTFGWLDIEALWHAALGRASGPGEAREVLLVSLPSMGERLIISLALLTYFKILSSYGTAAIAAYAIGVPLLALSWIPGLGFAAAASTFVGQALGAGDSARARRVGFRAAGQALGVMCVVGFAFLFMREPLAKAFTSDARVAADLTPFMLMLAIAQPFMGTHFTLGGVLRGAGDTMTPFVGAAVGSLCFRVPLAWVFARVLGAPLPWVWSALVFDHLARVGINGVVFLRGGWARRTGATLRAVGRPAPPADARPSAP
jgi:putative MATE family efflux protein